MASDAAKALARLVGANIRAAREELELNGRELADALRKLDPERAPVPQRVSDWERGVQKPDERYMKALSQVLNRPIAWFYTDHSEPQDAPDLVGRMNGNGSEPSLADILEAVRSLDARLEEVQLAQAQAAASAAEVLARIEEALPPTGPAQRQQRQ